LIFSFRLITVLLARCLLEVPVGSMNTTAVILLRGENPHGPFVDVAGLPLVERSLMGLRRVGVRTVYVLCDRRIRQDVWEHFKGREDPRLPEVTVQDPADLPSADLPARFLVLDGYRVFHNNLLSDAVRRDEPVAYFDDGKPAGIAVSRPDLPVEPTLFDSLKKTDLPEGTFAQPAETPGGAKEAKRLVFRSLIKPTDGWFSVNLNRPVSMSISRILVRTPVHPNVVTGFTTLIGIASGLFPMLGTYLGFVVGGLLYQLASILDGVDGELARVKFLGSRTGEWLDTIGDDLTNVIYLAGVTVGVYRSMDAAVLVWLGIAAVLVFVITHAIMYWLLAVRFHSGDMFGFQWDIKKPGKRPGRVNRFLLSLEPFTRRDCYAFLFMALALARVAWVALPAALVGTGGTLAVMLSQIVRSRKKESGAAVGR
jgi:phosphatidylglycerophosphate synthase